MKFLRKKHNVIVLTLMLITVISLYQSNMETMASTEQNTDKENTKAIVLFHQGKNQYFNSTIMKGALDLLTSNNFSVKFSSEPLNRTSLTGIDVLITSGSPKAPSGQELEYRYSNQEISFINEWTLQPRHGLILLSNPYTSNVTLDMNNNNLNLIITQLEAFPGSRFSVGSSGEGIAIQKLEKGDYDDNTILTIPLLNSTEFSFKNGSKIITKSNHAQAHSDYILAKAGLDAFGISSDGTFDLGPENPIILGGYPGQITTSRLFLMGSALMFSDLPGPDSTNSTNISWLNTASNAEVWIDAIDWTINAKSDNELQENLDFLLLFVAGQISLGAIFIFAGFVIFIRNKDVIPQATTTSVTKRESQDLQREKEKSIDNNKQKIHGKKQIKSSRRKKKRK